MNLPIPLHFQLHRNAHGRLVLTLADGTEHAGVLPVRAFPLAAPDEGLSLVGAGGQELLWIERLADLPAQPRSLLQEELAAVRRARHPCTGQGVAAPAGAVFVGLAG